MDFVSIYLWLLFVCVCFTKGKETLATNGRGRLLGRADEGRICGEEEGVRIGTSFNLY